MQHTYGLIAGAAALALAGVLSVQTGLFAQRQDAPPEAPPTAPSPVAEVAAPEPPAAVEASAAALEERIAILETRLADREAALAELGETLAARDADLAEMTAALADRDAELTALRGQLADLELELAELRERFAFDIQLAALKAAEPAASEAAALDDPAPPAAEQPLTRIHFDTGSARLSPGGQVHAAAAAVMLAEMKLGSVRLVGFTDRTGSPARNRALAEDRARAVADFLVAQGVPAQLIETAGVTEGALPVPTDPGVPEPLNRSVSIVAVPLPTT
jgi:outer membrane protein OmpA-like peptidoglycan-associated protein